MRKRHMVHRVTQHGHRSYGIVRSRTVKHRQTPLDLAIRREQDRNVKVFSE